MDVVRTDDGGRRFQLGPIEMAIVGLIPAVMLCVFGWNWNKAIDTIDAQGDALAKMTTQLAVLQDNVTQLRVQLADYPGLSQRVSRLEVATEAHKEQLQDLRIRGLP